MASNFKRVRLFLFLRNEYQRCSLEMFARFIIAFNKLLNAISFCTLPKITMTFTSANLYLYLSCLS
jgi:hypothetical protein